ncbi:hypothetical protein D3C71_1983910 [compost metagenome]
MQPCFDIALASNCHRRRFAVSLGPVFAEIDHADLVGVLFGARRRLAGVIGRNHDPFLERLKFARGGL